jgi:hypothetical protein
VAEYRFVEFQPVTMTQKLNQSNHLIADSRQPTADCQHKKASPTMIIHAFQVDSSNHSALPD